MQLLPSVFFIIHHCNDKAADFNRSGNVIPPNTHSSFALKKCMMIDDMPLLFRLFSLSFACLRSNYDILWRKFNLSSINQQLQIFGEYSADHSVDSLFHLLWLDHTCSKLTVTVLFGTFHSHSGNC
jgi:hypothetical protein